MEESEGEVDETHWIHRSTEGVSHWNSTTGREDGKKGGERTMYQMGLFFLK